MNTDHSFLNKAAPPATPEWHLVQSFLAVVDAGSLSAAARWLGVSQPTLSRQMAALGASVGAELFVRSTRGLRLTDAGTALLEPARRMQAAAQALSLTAAGQTQQIAGSVRLTASEMTAAYILPPLLTELRRLHPQIQIELIASNREENLLEREADIAVRHVRPRQGGLIARRVGDLPMQGYAHRDYLAARGGRATPERLHEYDWIGLDRSDLLLRGFSKAGLRVEREFFGFRCDNQIVCWQAALAGMGIAFAAERVARAWSSMEPALPDGMVEPMPLWLVTHRELRQSARIRRVFDWLAVALKEMLDRQ
jgi:DNA-binding transcriptional LysR family regulator